MNNSPTSPRRRPGSTVWINGRFRPAHRATVSVFDRSFQLGDGLFESIRVVQGAPFQWADHLERLNAGARFLRIRLPYTPERLHEAATQLIARHDSPEGVLRLHLSRGVGLRGYSPRGADSPVAVISFHPTAPSTAPARRWKLTTASVRLAHGDPLGRFKTASKLTHIVARMEAESAGADEALLLDTTGCVAEAAASNLFWVRGDRILTPPLSTGALSGITRGLIRELCRKLGLKFAERRARIAELKRADAVFLTTSPLGIIPVSHLDGARLKSSRILSQLRRAYASAIAGPALKTTYSAVGTKPRRS